MLHALEEAYQHVQQVNDLQRCFLADASHELRTPLTIMLSSLELMKKEEGSDPEFQTSALENIYTEAERMARLTTRLLLLARTDARAPFVRQPLLIVDIISEAYRQGCPSHRKITMQCQGLETLLPLFRGWIRACKRAGGGHQTIQCPLKAQCTTSAKGRSVSIHPDEALLIELRQRQRTPQGRAKLRERVAVAHTLAYVDWWQGRCARHRGIRKNLFDLRRCAVVHNLHVLARSQQYEIILKLTNLFGRPCRMIEHQSSG